MGYKIRLSLMMFLQYAIWGAWAPVLSEYLINRVGFTGTQVGIIYSLLPLATIISPFLGGQLADRYFPTEKVIAFLQLFGGGILIYTSFVSDYSTMVWLIFVYSVLYAPTLALTNSIAFINLKDSEKEFGMVRVWGTIGWITAGLILAGWRMMANSHQALAIRGDTLMLAGIFSLIMGIQSFSLPHTPPKKEVKKPWAFLEALKMLRDKNLAIFFGITFIVATELQFYYILTAPYLTSEKIGVKPSMVSGVMVIAQVAEILVMAVLLPIFLPKFGIKKTMIIGVLAWPARYIIFVIARPVWLVIASLSLHGFCYVFFFTAAFIYIDKVSPKDIRASAQSLIAIVTLGLGNFLGSLFAGWIQTLFTEADATNWRGVFMVPSVLTVLCAVVFILLFKEKKKVDVD
ncbi:MAG: MFS transporter [Candidatus Aminicenantes bacterium]